MRIDGDRWLAKGGIQNHVRCLASNAGQRFQLFPRGGNLRCVPLYQQPAGLDDVPGFGIKQADRTNVLLQSPFAEFLHGLRGTCDLEQRRGRLIDTHVRRLRGQDNGNQQLELRSIMKFGGRPGIPAGEPDEYLCTLSVIQSMLRNSVLVLRYLVSIGC